MTKHYHEKKASHTKRTIKYFVLLLLLATLALGCIYALSLRKDAQDQAASAISTQNVEPSQAAIPDSHQTQPDPAVNAAAPEGPSVQREVVFQGETAGGILQKWLDPNEVHEVVNVCSQVYPLSSIKSGQSYTVYEDEHGLSRFEYEINDDKMLVICREAQTFTATLENIEYDVLLTKVDGLIKSNLFNAMDEAGENSALAIALADVFAWEINFIKDLRAGDSFSMVVEKRYKDGEFKSYGRLLAAAFTNSGKKFEAFSFEDTPGDAQYFTAEGESVKHAFLKAPLSFTRISSGFSKSRLHPILKTYRPHHGIDYAAPTGTPVKAIGKATVTYSGWEKGAGNYVTLRHFNGYETYYMHLSAFAKGMKKGNTVKQGEVIGYVGSTGYSTGPHLDFRMKKNGSFINPLQALSPRDTPISAKNIKAFKEQIYVYRDYLEGKQALPN